MSKKPNYYTQVVHALQELHKLYPDYNMGRHLATALDDYGDVWGVSDKELLFALSKYKNQLSLDFPHEEKDIEKIIQGGMDLDNLFKEEEDYGDSY